MKTPQLKGYTILKQIGNGAGSVVFKIREESTGRELALKSVTPEIVDEIQKHAPSPEAKGDPGMLVRIYRSQVRNEWLMARQLDLIAGGHAGIPKMHRLIVERSLLFLPRGLHLIMDFVEGDNLRKKTDFTVPQLVRIYRQSADILRFLHQNNIIHADMKPHHIIVDTEKDLKVQLLDLGLACRRQGHARRIVGSPDYMSPEQLAGAGVDERTDVFGLGATMYWALTGHTIRPSVGGSSTMGAMDFQSKSLETSVRKYNPGVPPALEDIVVQSCAASRRERITLTDVIARLDRLM